MKEVYKPVVGWEGFYEVSNLGNVRSVDRTITRMRKGKPHVLNSKGIARKTRNHNVYPQVILYKPGEAYTITIHRLVAMAHIPNPDNLKEVNHIDGNKFNNVVTNLEWCTRQQNITHAIVNGLRKKKVAVA